MIANSTFLATGVQLKSDIVATVVVSFLVEEHTQIESPPMMAGNNRPDVFIFSRPVLIEEGQRYATVVQFLKKTVIAKDSKITIALLEVDLTDALRIVEHKKKVHLAPSAKRRVLANAYQAIYHLGMNQQAAVEKAVSIESRASDGLIV